MQINLYFLKDFVSYMCISFKPETRHCIGKLSMILGLTFAVYEFSHLYCDSPKKKSPNSLSYICISLYCISLSRIFYLYICISLSLYFSRWLYRLFKVAIRDSWFTSLLILRVFFATISMVLELFKAKFELRYLQHI